MSEKELVEKYGIKERGKTVISKCNLTAAEIAMLKSKGWKDDRDSQYLIK